jgi:hypothetical protein
VSVWLKRIGLGKRARPAPPELGKASLDLLEARPEELVDVSRLVGHG